MALSVKHRLTLDRGSIHGGFHSTGEQIRKRICLKNLEKAVVTTKPTNGHERRSLCRQTDDHLAGEFSRRLWNLNLTFAFVWFVYFVVDLHCRIWDKFSKCLFERIACIPSFFLIENDDHGHRDGD